MKLEYTTATSKFTVLDAITKALGGVVTRRAENTVPAATSWAYAWQDVRVDGVVISLHYNEDKRKGDYISVSGSWPRDSEHNVVTGRDAEYNAVNPSINITASKRPEVIAADIKRRFLPEFSRLYAKAAAIVATRDTYAANVQRNTERLAKAGNARISERGMLHNLPDSVQVKYVSDTRVDLVLECSVEEACEILRQRAKKRSKA